jgi:molybdopterin biosynthesis enzyme MoaB
MFYVFYFTIFILFICVFFIQRRILFQCMVFNAIFKRAVSVSIKQTFIFLSDEACRAVADPIIPAPITHKS